MSPKLDPTQRLGVDLMKETAIKLNLISIGAFSVAAGFLAASTSRQYLNLSLLIASLALFAVSFLIGYFCVGNLVYQLFKSSGNFDPNQTRGFYILQVVIFAIAGAIFVFFVVSNLPVEQPATDPSIEAVSQALDDLSNDPYFVEAYAYLSSWNNGEFQIPASSSSNFDPIFRKYIDQRTTESPGGYEDASWADAILSNWEMLPDNLSPILPLSDSAVLFLSSQVADHSDALMAQGSSSDQIPLILERPIYQVLGLAQIEAIDDQSMQITYDHVIASEMEWWTTIWPFCRIP